MSVLLGMIVFFSFLGLIGTLLIFIYTKVRENRRFDPKKLLKIIKGLAIVFVVALVLGGIVGGHSNDTKAVQAQAKQDQNDGNVTDKAINSGKYTGTLNNGKRDGNGTFTAANGDIYKGEWKDNKMNGKGTLNYANGDVYSGYYENGLRSGKGTFTWKESKDTYTGDWKADAMSGQGVYEFCSGENVGDKYNGEWNNNKMEGKGTYTFKDAKTLTGTWKDNKCISESK